MSVDPYTHRTQHFANPAHVSLSQESVKRPRGEGSSLGFNIVIGIFTIVILLNLLMT